MKIEICGLPQLMIPEDNSSWLPNDNLAPPIWTIILMFENVFAFNDVKLHSKTSESFANEIVLMAY